MENKLCEENEKFIENVKCDSVCAVLSLWLKEEPRIVVDR